MFTNLICGKGVGDIVRDGRTLKAMARAKNIIWPVDQGHFYVDHKNLPRDFRYRGQAYETRYFDGCFFPFVVKVSEKLDINTSI